MNKLLIQSALFATTVAVLASNSAFAQQLMATDIAKPERAKADLVVEMVGLAPNDATKVAVNIKNIGSSLSQGGQSSVRLQDGTTRAGNMPDIKPGETRLVYVQFRSAVKGRVVATADSSNNIMESNENNNAKAASL